MLILSVGETQAGSEHAATPEDKSQYNLFHPVPAARMRDFNADRPSLSDSAQTIDAGHVQLETDFANYTFDTHNPQRERVRVDQWNVFTPVVRVGVTDRVEFDIQYDGYFNVRERDRTTKPTRVEATSGVGDLSLGSKISVWGNGEDQTSLALFPVLKIPTNTAGLGNRYVEGKVGVPFEAKLPAGFRLNIETEIGAIRDGDDTHYVAQFTNIIDVAHDLGIKNLAGYVEFYGEVRTEHGMPVIGQVDVGVTYQIGDNMQLDGGCNIGVTRAANDYQPFTGLSVRF